MASDVQKRSSMIKRIAATGMKVGRLPRIFARPARRYRKIAAYYGEGGDMLGASILEVADTDELRRRGLMGRENLPWVCGMIFEGLSGWGYFWMKDCKVPLDVMFIDGDGRIKELYSMPVDPKGRHKYRYGDEETAIEVPMGFCEKYGIKRGCTVKVRELRGDE